jgi:hypothetical protein
LDRRILPVPFFLSLVFGYSVQTRLDTADIIVVLPNTTLRVISNWKSSSTLSKESLGTISILVPHSKSRARTVFVRNTTFVEEIASNVRQQSFNQSSFES